MEEMTPHEKADLYRAIAEQLEHDRKMKESPPEDAYCVPYNDVC